MKVFLSHQKADSELASRIARHLKVFHQIECYLDLIDPNASSAGDQLGEYLRNVLSECTQLMAVVSSNTKQSWWVPWEIGIATEKDYPIATFAGDATDLPEYLKKWPYLRDNQELDKYATISKSTETDFSSRKQYLSESTARRYSTRDFHRSLRSSLNQL